VHKNWYKGKYTLGGWHSKAVWVVMLCGGWGHRWNMHKSKEFYRVGEQEEKGVRGIPCMVSHGRTAFLMKVCGKCVIQLVLKRYHNTAVV